MENKFLHQLLQAGLLAIGDSDERLENIEKSIVDLEAKLKNEQSLLPAYTLVALDPNVGNNEPVLQEVEAIVASHWKALRAKFADRPVSILRAVILHALYNIGIQDAKIARIIFLSASNFYPFAKLGREKAIVETILSELGELAEKNAVDEWSLDDEEPTLKLGTLKITNFTFASATINRDQLKNEIKVAVSNEPTHNHGSNHGGNGHWGEHFANKSSDAITNAFNTALGQFSQSLSPASLETPLNKFFSEFKKSLDQTLKSSFNSIRAVERRSKLLWWKETLYSSSLKTDYRSVNDVIQPIIMASDLYTQLPDVAPISVDYLLKDMLLILNNKADDKLAFSDVLKEITKDENKATLKGYFDEGVDNAEKRITITDFLSLLVFDKVNYSTLKKYTGIDGSEKVSLNELSVMVLHDLMADYLIPKEK